MIKRLFILVFIFSSFAYADVETQKYAIQNPDGSVAIKYYVPGNGKSLEQDMQETGYGGLTAVLITDESFLKDRKDRKYWKVQNGKLAVDTEKKQADLDAKAAKDSEKDAIFSKLKISRQEFEKIKS